jgi:hypothetical protein
MCEPVQIIEEDGDVDVGTMVEQKAIVEFAISSML